MIWSLITSHTKYLSEDFQRAESDFDKELSGQTTELPKWRSCITDTDDNLGFALGALFVKETFQGKSKERVGLQGLSDVMNFSAGLELLLTSRSL